MKASPMERGYKLGTKDTKELSFDVYCAVCKEVGPNDMTIEEKICGGAYIGLPCVDTCEKYKNFCKIMNELC